MNGVRANWFADVVIPEGADPFGTLGTPTPVALDAGVPIDLRDPDGLQRQLSAAIEVEAQMFNQGITCPIRDAHGSACSACPVSHHQDDEHEMRPLCVSGRRQEELVSAIVAAASEIR